MVTRRRAPRYLDQYRYADGSRMTPVEMLNADDAVPFTLAAQWVYAPDFVEYRGGIFWKVDATGESDSLQRAVDRWLDELDGDVARVEAIVNALIVFDFFASVDLEPYVDDLPDFVRTVGRTWGALLRTEFPERSFEVLVDDGDDEESYGPQVTFRQRR